MHEPDVRARRRREGQNAVSPKTRMAGSLHTESAVQIPQLFTTCLPIQLLGISHRPSRTPLRVETLIVATRHLGNASMSDPRPGKPPRVQSSYTKSSCTANKPFKKRTENKGITDTESLKKTSIDTSSTANDEVQPAIDAERSIGSQTTPQESSRTPPLVIVDSDKEREDEEPEEHQDEHQDEHSPSAEEGCSDDDLYARPEQRATPSSRLVRANVGMSPSSRSGKSIAHRRKHATGRMQATKLAEELGDDSPARGTRVSGHEVTTPFFSVAEARIVIKTKSQHINKSLTEDHSLFPDLGPGADFSDVQQMMGIWMAVERKRLKDVKILNPEVVLVLSANAAIQQLGVARGMLVRRPWREGES